MPLQSKCQFIETYNGGFFLEGKTIKNILSKAREGTPVTSVLTN